MIGLWLVGAVCIRCISVSYKEEILLFIRIKSPEWLYTLANNCNFCIGYNVGIIEGICWGGFVTSIINAL